MTAGGRETATQTSVTQGVFDALLSGIVEGEYASGARLPAERELAQQLGASRSALREAIRRLTAWRLVEPRRGSGVVVRDRNEWAVEVLPAYIRSVAMSGRLERMRSVLPLVVSMLRLRRVVLSEVIAMASGRIGAGGLERARALLGEAWEARHDPVEFVEKDFRMIRSVVEAAEMMPAVWMLNSVAGVYLEIASQFAFGGPVADDYRDELERVFAALERGDGEAAARDLGEYLERHDARLLVSLEGLLP